MSIPLRVLRAVFCLVITLLFFSPTSQADDLLDTMQNVNVRLSDRWEVKVETENKWRNGMSRYYDFEWMPWAAYQFTDWFKLGAGYRQLYSTRKGTDKWLVEQRPLMDLIFSTELCDWRVENRCRFEDRNVEIKKGCYAKPYFRYRNRIRVTAPWAWTKAEIRPWVAWETYYDDSPTWRSYHWNRNRYFVGLGAKLGESVRVGCYYFREKALINGGGREWSNELGFDVTLLFDFSKTPKSKLEKKVIDEEDDDAEQPD